MYNACETKYGKREIQFSKATKERKEQGPYVQYRTRWTGQDIADFISVSIYTGLRISDVRPHEARRHDPVQGHQGAHARLRLGSRVVAATHPHPLDRPVYFRGAQQ